MNKQEKLAELRHLTAQYGLPPDRPLVPLGLPEADAFLGGGLKPGVLHEIFAKDWGASGFALCLALRALERFQKKCAAVFRPGPRQDKKLEQFRNSPKRENAPGKKPLFFIRTDYAALEYGALSPSGFLELGGDPQKLFLLSLPHISDALAAAADILSCSSVGGAVLEIEGPAPLLDLTASRRLNLLAEESGVTLFLLREGASPRPSAAVTRWEVQSAPSRACEDWGAPRFLARLTRNRLGLLGEWIMEWNPQHGIFQQDIFQQDKAHSGSVAQASSDRPAHAAFARAG